MEMSISVHSEIGKLNGVIIHTPGSEVENMTPGNAERALYSDILNLSVVNREYKNFKNILNKVTHTFQIKSLLADILQTDDARDFLLTQICQNEPVENIRDYLSDLEAKELAAQLIEGVHLIKNTLTRYLSNERYSLQPLHNFFYTRDTAMVIGQKVFISRMSNQVREREALIMEAIQKFHPAFSGQEIISPAGLDPSSQVFFEGGDFLVIRDDILVVGTGIRTSSYGVDYIIESLAGEMETRHIIVQELPKSPESFIHLDMAFTMIDHDLFMIYEPVILNQHDFQTVHITLDNGKVSSINEEKNIPDALRKLGIDSRLAVCGGNTDDWIQEREQWHSGANFFALGPGQVIGYERNNHTIEELNKNNLSILPAQDILSGKIDLKDYNKYAITMEGSELARGGGGCRCMTMPVSREPL
jgi:arginine deiminase